MSEIEIRYKIGDSVELLKELPDASVDLFLGDPPFNVNIKYGSHYKDNMTPEVYFAWVQSWVTECFRALKPTGNFLLFSSPKHFREFLNILHATGFTFKDIIIWHKTNAHMPMGKAPMAKLEPCYWTVKSPKYTYNNTGLCNIMEFAVIQPNCREYIEGNPAQRPVAMYEKLVRTFSNEGDLVVDPFVGSGTTLLACRRARRNGLGFDLNPKMEEVIKRHVYLDVPDVTDLGTKSIENF